MQHTWPKYKLLRLHNQEPSPWRVESHVQPGFEVRIVLLLSTIHCGIVYQTIQLFMLDEARCGWSIMSYLIIKTI